MTVIGDLYQILKDFNAAVRDEQLQQALVEKANKQAFRSFYYDWITFRDAGLRADYPSFVRDIADSYANVMLQILSGMGPQLSPHQKNQLQSFITELRKISATIEISELNVIDQKMNQAAEKAKMIFEGS